MLIVFQAPFADVRDFISIDTYKLKKPDWSNINPYLRNDFIHRFGVIEKPRRKSKEWTSTEVQCTSKKAFKFNTSEIENLAKHKYGMVVYNRRLFCTETREIGKGRDGISENYQNKIIGSLEIGFIHANREKMVGNYLSANDLKNIIKRCMKLNVTINLSKIKSVRSEIYNINTHIGKAYLHATTKRGEINQCSDWWIRAGAPLLIVEYSSSEVNEVPMDVKLIKDFKEKNIRIFFGDFVLNKTSRLKTWYIETNNLTNSKVVGNLIEGLLHINSSQQCLNRVLDVYEKLDITKGTEEYDKFQQYVAFTFFCLFRREKFGFPCKEFGEILQECEETVSKTIRDGILTKFKELGIRGNYIRNLGEYIDSKGRKNHMSKDENPIDILILTAVKDEFDIVLGIESDWNKKQDKSGYDYYVRDMINNKGEKLTVGMARAVNMGTVSATNLATRLSNELNPKCLAMVGICAGWRDKVVLGDVIVADRVFSYDEGKLIQFENNGISEEELFNDIRTYNLLPLWKQKAQDMSSDWKLEVQADRPLEYKFQEIWLLKAIDDFSKGLGEDPVDISTRKKCCPNWSIIVERLIKKELIKIDINLELTDEGKKEVRMERTIFPDGREVPLQSNVHVAPIATGAKVIEDRKAFRKISRNVRTVLGIEMEASAVGAVAELEQISRFIVVKAVSDYADEDKNDHFRSYSIESSYRFLCSFLKENYVQSK
ncbi:hypothetical protein [Clostridium saccharoperbutylacetonicum]|uniref:5'-methylthioadenosine/S-adenosylhomocysteine nucleosidase family protein n=1 Tax=Clostridium saccharoperbutylacetonicum TaxID=36745 RepID=UPI0039E757B1